MLRAEVQVSPTDCERGVLTDAAALAQTAAADRQLVVSVGSPPHSARGRLAEFIDQRIEAGLGSLGALPRPAYVSNSAGELLADQLYRARLVGLEGFCVLLDSLGALRVAGVLMEPDLDCLRCWSKATCTKPVNLCVTDFSLSPEERAALGLCGPLGADRTLSLLPDTGNVCVGDDVLTPSEREESFAEDVDNNIDLLADALDDPADALDDPADALDDPADALDDDPADALDDDPADALDDPARDAIVASDLDGDLLQLGGHEPGFAREPTAAPQAPEQLWLPMDLPAVDAAEGAPALELPGDPSHSEADAGPIDVTESVASGSETPPEIEPPGAAESPPPMQRCEAEAVPRQQYSEASAAGATPLEQQQEPPAPPPSDPGIHLAVLRETPDAVSWGGLEQLYIDHFLPLQRHLPSEAPDGDGLRDALRSWAGDFESGYARAFERLRRLGQRPNMVLDVPRMSFRIARSHGAKSIRLVLVDGMRLDIGRDVQDRLSLQLTSFAECVGHGVLWAALPSQSGVQLELLARGADGLRNLEASLSEQELVSISAARHLRGMRVGPHVVHKLDAVEVRLQRQKLWTPEDLSRSAAEVAVGIGRFVKQQKPETLVFIFGDHGFRRDDGRTGGASPEEVLSGYQAWLVR